MVGIITSCLSLDNGLGRTPPMGWNSWKHDGCSVNQFEIQWAAEAFVSQQLDKVGYKYINVDDCWIQTRDSSGNLMPDLQLFPDIINMIEYIHSKGLLVGLDADGGTSTCAGRPGSLSYEERDAQQFANMKVDYLKYDNCNNQNKDVKERYLAMSKALNKTGRPIFFAMSEGGIEDSATWGPGLANSWRVNANINDNWSSMIWTVNVNNKLAEYAGPGGWNDPDVLMVGNGGMSTTEYETQMSLWCLMKAPLIVSCDVTNMSNDTKRILTNEEVIAVNQDPLGVQGKKVKINEDTEVWGGRLDGGSYVVILLNRGDKEAVIKMEWSDLGLKNGTMYHVRDLWMHTDLDSVKDQVNASVQSHGVKMYKLTPA